MQREGAREYVPLEVYTRSTAGMMGRMEQTGVAKFQISNWNWSSLLTKLGHLCVCVCQVRVIIK